VLGDCWLDSACQTAVEKPPSPAPVEGRESAITAALNKKSSKDRSPEGVGGGQAVRVQRKRTTDEAEGAEGVFKQKEEGHTESEEEGKGGRRDRSTPGSASILRGFRNRISSFA
jgi:hypothetical protein